MVHRRKKRERMDEIQEINEYTVITYTDIFNMVDTTILKRMSVKYKKQHIYGSSGTESCKILNGVMRPRLSVKASKAQGSKAGFTLAFEVYIHCQIKRAKRPLSQV